MGTGSAALSSSGAFGAAALWVSPRNLIIMAIGVSLQNNGAGRGGSKRRLAGDTARAATSEEVKALRQEARALKEVVAEQGLELRLPKKI